MQTSPTKPLVTFNHRYEAIHKVAFGLSPSQQDNRTVIVEYAKKLPINTRDKLLRKIAKKNSYIKTLDDAFKQAIEINRETSEKLQEDTMTKAVQKLKPRLMN